MDAVDPDVTRVADGLHFNSRFSAPNVWEIDVDADAVDAAARIFGDGAPFASVTADGEWYEQIDTSVGAFFLQRINWQSDACWVSVDDRAAYEAFLSIFRRMRVPDRLAPFFPQPGGVRLYSAFYVVRSECRAHNFHVDYHKEVGVDAMTLITPLREYATTDSFQLSYIAEAEGRLRAGGVLDEGDPGTEIRRYVYRKGKAVVFGSRFLHSTEPGSGADGEPHAYLSFTFGTTDQAAWPQIARTLDTQSRVLALPEGDFVLSRLGGKIEEAVAAARRTDDADEC